MLNKIKSWGIYIKAMYYSIKAVWYRNIGSKHLDQKRYHSAWEELDIAIEAAEKFMFLTERYEELTGRPF